MPKLVAFLDEPDPNTAVLQKTKDGDREVVVRETVKMNHHRSCIVCHRAAEENSSFPNLVVRMPAPDEPLPPLVSKAYLQRAPRVPRSIQANEVELRQDFSRLRKVADPGNWPEMQRFDYLVRTRTLTVDEAIGVLTAPDKIGRAQPQTPPTPHQRAILYALTRLTGLYRNDCRRVARSDRPVAGIGQEDASPAINSAGATFFPKSSCPATSMTIDYHTDTICLDSASPGGQDALQAGRRHQGNITNTRPRRI